ncbi:hypothetical protein F5X96DRAFT_258430 [Biscogniauxia mediterranea]|nr:hypothetical protein F5X96DRAFT_258430 [Biscogniauxia mediterranea]
MDGTGIQKEPRERSYTRIPSRTSTPNSAKTNSSSHLREMAHAGSHASQKYHHSHCGTGSNSAMSSPRLSREPSRESRQAIQPVSGLLQERLQRERRAESERLAGGGLSSSTGDIRDRDVPKSPVRRSATATGRRPMSDSGDELPSKDNGMGAKQMEKTVSTLHKQNFDLKLELYHRRERQTFMEQRLEVLEAEQLEMDAERKKFASELEQRDKAVQEAVNIIIQLEAKVDELLREREMVRRVEADGLYRHSQSDGSESVATETPRMASLTVPQTTLGSNKDLERMPSFLSEHSELTENLRSVVLQNQDSFMNLRQFSTSTIPSETNRLASPSLSVLSESSFMSIYGTKEGDDTSGLPPLEDLAGMDGSQSVRWPAPAMHTGKEGWEKLKNPPSDRNLKTEPKGGTRLLVRKRSVKDMIELSSPLQKLERLERHGLAIDDLCRRSVSSQSGGAATSTSTSTPSRPAKSPPQAKTKQEKRDALNRVLTNYAASKEFANAHTLPPTPDTVSSSVLRKHQTFGSSRGSFEKPTGGNINESIPAALSDRSRRSTSSLGFSTSPRLNTRQVSTSAFSGRRNLPPPIMNDDPYSSLSQLAQSIPPRPHSAADTISTLTRADSFISDSDSDGGVDARSEAESYDYWMRESEKPNKYHPQKANRSGRTPSPDLFTFPADPNGWGTDAIFNALKGNGFLGPPVSALKRDPMDEVPGLPSLHLEPIPKGPSPAPPSRRSSLLAHTGSFSASAAAAQSGGLFKKSSVRDSSAFRLESRGRSNSVDVGASRNQHQHQHQPPAAEAGRRSQYPPISGAQQPRGRGLGLNTLFKRSGSETRSSGPPSAVEASSTVPPLHHLPPSGLTRPSGRSSVPPPAAKPWALRPPAAFDDDFSSATPPPIMRNRVPPPPPSSSGTGMDGGGEDLALVRTPTSATFGPDTPTAVGSSAAGSVSGSPRSTPVGGGSLSSSKRKWLGLGRMGSLKSRTG